MADQQPTRVRRAPTPIVHTCDTPDNPKCPCRRARQAEQQRERRRTQQRYINHVDNTNLRRLYGIELGEYEALRIAQGHRCAICRRHESELPTRKGGRKPVEGGEARSSRPLVVDHCHDGGQVRGLLCTSCNQGLGHFLDDPRQIRMAARFLTGGTMPDSESVA